MNTRRLTEVEQRANEALDARIEAVLVKLRPIHFKHAEAFKAEAVTLMPEVTELVAVVDTKYSASDSESLTATQMELAFMWLALHPGA